MRSTVPSYYQPGTPTYLYSPNGVAILMIWRCTNYIAGESLEIGMRWYWDCLQGILRGACVRNKWRARQQKNTNDVVSDNAQRQGRATCCVHAREIWQLAGTQETRDMKRVHPTSFLFLRTQSTIISHRAPSNTPLTSSTVARSVKNGTRSVSSVSWGSLNQEDTGTALFGWKIYDAGELSRMIMSATGRPSCDRSCVESVDRCMTVHQNSTPWHSCLCGCNSSPGIDGGTRPDGCPTYQAPGRHTAKSRSGKD